MKVRPVGERVYLRVLDCKPKKTAAGILLTSDMRGREDQAEVLAVGRGVEDKKGRVSGSALKPGDKVWFDPYQIDCADGDTTNSVYGRPGDEILIRERHIHGVIV